MYDDGIFLGCEQNKIGDFLVALYHYDTIYLIGESYPTVMYSPKLLFHKVSDEKIHIDDVLMKDNNVGNGSMIMRALIRYALYNGVKIITGYLSSVDNDHKSRRDHYYEKFGFKISSNSIVKYLE
jgi:hypothetical protein